MFIRVAFCNAFCNGVIVTVNRITKNMGWVKEFNEPLLKTISNSTESNEALIKMAKLIRYMYSSLEMLLMPSVIRKGGSRMMMQLLRRQQL